MSTSALAAANIRAELARQHLSQRALAPILGVSATGVSKRLSGITPIDVDELGKIADFLGINAATLIQDAA